MSDFVLYKHGGGEILADDVIRCDCRGRIRYIEPHTHERRTIHSSEIKTVYKERRGFQGGPAFEKKEIHCCWRRLRFD
jgi:hypothetical protein